MLLGAIVHVITFACSCKYVKKYTSYEPLSYESCCMNTGTIKIQLVIFYSF